MTTFTCSTVSKYTTEQTNTKKIKETQKSVFKSIVNMHYIQVLDNDQRLLVSYLEKRIDLQRHIN